MFQKGWRKFRNLDLRKRRATLQSGECACDGGKSEVVAGRSSRDRAAPLQTSFSKLLKYIFLIAGFAGDG
jgi:hypothetical protein